MYLEKTNSPQPFIKKFKAFFNGTKPLFLLINETFWKGLVAPFLAFVFPLFFITILGLMLGYDQVLAGSLGIPGIMVSLNSMPLLIFEFKNSSLLKRIGATPVKPSLFIFITFVYYMGIIVLAVIWCILFSLLLFGTQYWDTGRVVSDSTGVTIRALSFKDTLANVNWGTFIYGIIVSMAVGLSVGMFFVALAKSVSFIQTMGVTIMVLSLFLSAQVIPPGMAVQSPGIWYAGYALSPFKGTTNIFLESWNGQLSENSLNSIYNMVTTTDGSYYLQLNVSVSNSFDLSTPWEFTNFEGSAKTVILTTQEKICNIVLPYVWIVLFLAVAIKKFTWSTR